MATHQSTSKNRYIPMKNDTWYLTTNKLLNERILTFQNMMCTICYRWEESVRHLLWECDFVVNRKKWLHGGVWILRD